MGKIENFCCKVCRFIRRIAYLSELEEPKKNESASESPQAAPARNPLSSSGFKAVSGLNLDDLIEYSIIDEDYRRQRMMSATDYFERLEQDEVFWDELE